jgi:hypothetical protein
VVQAVLGLPPASRLPRRPGVDPSAWVGIVQELRISPS